MYMPHTLHDERTAKECRHSERRDERGKIELMSNLGQPTHY